MLLCNFFLIMNYITTLSCTFRIYNNKVKSASSSLCPVTFYGLPYSYLFVPLKL